MKQTIIIIIGIIIFAIAVFRQGPAPKGIRKDFKKDANKDANKGASKDIKKV